MNRKIKIAVIGLGYVGLPTYLRLEKKFICVGFDINKDRIYQLKNRFDVNKEFSFNDLKLNKKSKFSNKVSDLNDSNFYIITVPTPIYPNKKPDLRPLEKSCKILNKVIKNEDIIFFESTVYPGLIRSLKNRYFKNKKIFLGYSPERLNPGDKVNTIKKIKKIVSYDSCPNIIKKNISKVYNTISTNIVFSKSIENAEMSKVIENIQRDINIAFMNEIFMVCKKSNLNFKEVIKLAKTKWNFLDFSPGLVGGHCLPVDPYYFYHYAKTKGHNAQFMLSGRKVNDELEYFIFKKIVEKIKSEKLKKILILGVSYKAQVSDLRNSLALNLYLKLKKKFKNKINAYDPKIDKLQSKKFNTLNKIKKMNNYDLIIPLVNHKNFKNKFYRDYKKNKFKYLDIFNYFSK